jgi:hypothetical protein
MVALADAGQQMRERHKIPAVPSAGLEELEVEQRYAGIWGQRPIWTAYTTASFSLFAAEDGMRAIGRLFAEPHEPVTVFAHMVIGRGVLEACARARWLLESSPGIDARVRVARVLAHRAVDLRERVHLESVIDAQHAAQTQFQLDELLRRAEARGMTRTTRRGNVVVDPAMPGYRQLVLDLFARSTVADGQLPHVIYSYFSSIAHAQTFGLMQSAARGEAVPDPIGGDVSVPVVTSSANVNSCIAFVTLGYLEAVEEQCRLMGWDDAEWKSAQLDAIQAIAAVLPRDVPHAA